MARVGYLFSSLDGCLIASVIDGGVISNFWACISILSSSDVKDFLEPKGIDYLLAHQLRFSMSDNFFSIPQVTEGDIGLNYDAPF